MEEFLQENNETLDEEYAFMKVYASAAIGSTNIVRTTSSFYSNECFSNVAVSVEGNRVVWYGKVGYNPIPLIRFESRPNFI